MRKIVGLAASLALSFFSRCIGTYISFSGSARLIPLYLKWCQASRKIQDWTSQSRIRTAPVEHEGLGGIYDKRKWMQSYYGNRPI